MKLKPDQIQGHLQRNLAPIYLVGGDEPLQVQETVDAIRARAREVGFTEREVLNVDKGFDWDSLLQSTQTQSLFGDKRLLELRLPGSKPGDQGGRALRVYAENPAPDTVLLIICGKLDSASTRTKWLQSLEHAGVFIQVWPVDADRLPQWIQQRMRSRGLQSSRDAVKLLADKVEGNLLAASQEIEKLLLLYGSGHVDEEAIAASVADSARFNLFGLVDSSLNGKPVRMSRMLSGLQGEGVEPTLILWAFSREIRALSEMAYGMSQGKRVETVLAEKRVWDRRKPLIKNALKRHPLSGWCSLLQRCSHIDRVIKGLATGMVWDELLQLGMILSGENFLEVGNRS
ncbi:MAG: DNA polymerase III subunit delta [Gammaproteobacteria bacterium]|nr:DNA polymerase III subunit delta [Gammaproteobacteria bacterium]